MMITQTMLRSYRENLHPEDFVQMCRDTAAMLMQAAEKQDKINEEIGVPEKVESDLPHAFSSPTANRTNPSYAIYKNHNGQRVSVTTISPTMEHDMAWLDTEYRGRVKNFIKSQTNYYSYNEESDD